MKTDIVPTHSKAPGRINKANRVGIEATGNGIHHGQLAERVDDVEDHNTSDAEANEDRSRTALSQGRTRTDEETSTN